MDGAVSEQAILQEVRDLIAEGVLTDDPKSPTLFVVTVVGNQRSDREDDVHKFISNAVRKYPSMELVVGDTSNLEKAAALAAEHQEIKCTVVRKADKGDFDEGAVCRDEKVVALSTQIVAFDKSARTKSYEVLAKRLRKTIHYV